MTVEEFIREHPGKEIDMMTPGGFVHLMPEQAKAVLSGSSLMGNAGMAGINMEIRAEELLPQQILSVKEKDGIYYMMTDNPPQGKREEVKEPIQSPDSLETGETVRTPRGTFHVTDMSREQMEAAGYGFHHQSGDGKYLVMSNGSRAFAIRNEPEQGRPARAAKAARGKGLGEKQLKKKKGKEMER